MFHESLKLISLMLLWVIVAAVLTDCEARSLVDRSENSDSNGSSTNRSAAEYQLQEYAEFMKSYMNQSRALREFLRVCLWKLSERKAGSVLTGQ